MKQLRKTALYLFGFVMSLVMFSSTAMAVTRENMDNVSAAVTKYGDSVLGKTIDNYNNGQAGGCHAFVNHAWKNVFGYDTYAGKSSSTAKQYDWTNFASWLKTNARPGDILRASGSSTTPHSIIISSVSSTGLTYYESGGPQNNYYTVTKHTSTYEQLVSWYQGRYKNTYYFLYQMGDTIYKSVGGTTPPPPSSLIFSNVRSSNVTENTAFIEVDVSCSNVSDWSKVGAQWGTSSSNLSQKIEFNVLNKLTFINVVFDGSEGPRLNSGTTYYYRFYAISKSGSTIYSGTEKFTTKSPTSGVTFTNVYSSKVTENTAYVYAAISCPNASNYSKVGVQYGTTSGMSQKVEFNVMNILTFCDVTFDGSEGPKLSPGTKYYYRFYVTGKSGGVTYSEMKTFTTLCDHSAMVLQSETQPTCTNAGSKVYICNKCKNYTTTSSIPALGHNYVVTVIKPTTAEVGYTLHMCSRCDDSYKTDIENKILCGTVKITGTLNVGKTLTATVSDSNNSGFLSYKWTRNDATISGATASTYTVTSSDLGKTIKCIVISSVETGSITSDGVQIIPGTPTLTVVQSGTSVKASWTAVSGVDGYYVCRKPEGGSYTKIATVSSSVVSYTDSSVAAGKSYVYAVKAYKGSVVGKYQEKSITVAVKLATPKLISATSVSTGVQVKWEASSGAQYYKVFYKVAGGSWKEGGCTSATSYTVTGLTDGVSYTFTVRCVASDKQTYTSDYDKTGKTVVYRKKLSTPVLSSVENTATGVKVTWKAVTGAEYYKVFYKVEGGSWKEGGCTSSTSCTVTGLTEGTSYTFTVRCVAPDKKTYTSDYDKTGKTIMFNRTLSTPVLSSVENTATGVKVTWKAVTGAGYYKVFYKVEGGKWIEGACTNATSCTVAGLTDGVTYSFTVRCVASDKKTYISGYDKTGMTIVFKKQLSTPVISGIGNTSTGVKVTWKAVTGAEYYKVFYKVAGGSWKEGGCTSSTSCTVTGLTSGTTYTFTVRCVASDKKTYTSSYDKVGITITYIK